MNRKEHWESIYTAKSPNEVSWFQKEPTHSLGLIRDAGLPLQAAIIDVGSGASTLIDQLLKTGYANVTALDISAQALDKAKARLGSLANNVQWRVGDITEMELQPAYFDLWHDRAVFHFLTDEMDRQKYVRKAETSLKPGAHLLIATFARDGPPKCSGLDVMRYDAASLKQEFGSKFMIIRHLNEKHRTPSGMEQKFIYVHLLKTG
jgi:SAM-dependent methyltransferase